MGGKVSGTILSTARGPWKKRLPQLVEMLVALGRAEIREGGVVGAGR